MNQNDNYRNFSFVLFGRTISLSLQAVFYLLFASLMEPESYGRLNVILALAGTFATFSRFGLNHSLQIFQAKKNSELSEQISTLFVLTTSIASLVLLPIDIFAAVLCLASSFFIMNQSYLAGLRKYKQFMLNYLLKSILNIGIPVFLFFIFEIPGIVLGVAISNLVGSIFYFRVIKIKSISEIKSNFVTLLHNYGVDIRENLPRMIDQLLIAPLLGFFIVGIYAFNMQIFYAIGIIPGAVYNYVLPEESIGTQFRRLNIITVIGVSLFTLLVIGFAPFLIENFFPKYSEGILSLQILILAIIPFSISSILSAKLQAHESKRVGFSAIVRIGTLLGLIVIFGQLYGLIGLSMAVIISIIADTFFLYLLYRKQFSKK